MLEAKNASGSREQAREKAPAVGTAGDTQSHQPSGPSRRLSSDQPQLLRGVTAAGSGAFQTYTHPNFMGNVGKRWRKWLLHYKTTGFVLHPCP